MGNLMFENPNTGANEDFLYQWDTRRRMYVNLKNVESTVEAVFSNANTTEAIRRHLTPSDLGWWCEVPDVLLQEATTLYISITYVSNGRTTVERHTATVYSQQKPEGYVSNDQPEYIQFDEAFQKAMDVINNVDVIKKDIEKKGADTLETIPDDYTELSNNVSQLSESITNIGNCVNGVFTTQNIHTDYAIKEGEIYYIYYRGADANIYSRVDSNNYIKVKNNGIYVLKANKNDTLSIVKTGGTDNTFSIILTTQAMFYDYIKLKNDCIKNKKNMSNGDEFYLWHPGGYNFSTRTELAVSNAIVTRDIFVTENTYIYIRVLKPTGFDGYIGENGASPTEFKSGRIIKLLEKGKTYRICLFNTGLSSLSEDYREILTAVDIRFDVIGVERTDHFTISVPCAIDRLSNTMAFQSEPHNDDDNAIIMLPKSYSRNGKKTRLVIFPHGAGGDITVNDSIVEKTVMAKYLVANGYAVMDTNGLPSEFASQYNYDINNNIGSWLAMRCYSKAYSYCMEHYNLYEDVFVFGESMGGLTSANLASSGLVPVKAVALACPVLDLYNNIWLHPWSGGAPKNNMIKFYEFTKDGSEYEYDEEKVTGYNPMTNKTIAIGEKKYTDFPCPVKIWHCENDDVVSFATSVQYVQQIKNHGGIARLRPMATGGHGPMGAGNVVTSTYGFIDYKEESLTIRSAMEEVFHWFNYYDNNVM